MVMAVDSRSRAFGGRNGHSWLGESLLGKLLSHPLDVHLQTGWVTSFASNEVDEAMRSGGAFRDCSVR